MKTIESFKGELARCKTQLSECNTPLSLKVKQRHIAYFQREINRAELTTNKIGAEK